MPSPATTLPSMLEGTSRWRHGPSARLSIASRKTAPCVSIGAPGAPCSYSAHFRRVLPMSTARKLTAARASDGLAGGRLHVATFDPPRAVALALEPVGREPERAVGIG